MRDANQENISSSSLTVEEYIQLELQSERRHEFINGQLIEMPGEKDINNQIAGFIYIYLVSQFRLRGYNVFMNDVKVGLPEKTKYYYPEVFLTKETSTESYAYIKFEAELIVEVISPSTHYRYC